jgi:hypothetical protein
MCTLRFLLFKKMITSKLAGSKFILNEEGVARLEMMHL